MDTKSRSSLKSAREDTSSSMSLRSIRCFIDWRSVAGCTADGSKKQGSADGAFTVSRRKVAVCWRVNGIRGRPLFMRWTSSREAIMPDWSEQLRLHLTGSGLSGAREAEIIEELSLHLDERYEDLRAAGATESEAWRLA